jgi:hypothetical protein
MHFDPRVSPWHFDDSELYDLGSRQEQLAFLLRYATLAPSVRNTQPWAFRVTADGVEVYADESRRLAIIDPANRSLLMSVGAAIANLRVAAAHFGFDTSVLYDSPAEPSPRVALVSFVESCAPDEKLAQLFRAIKQRRTNRRIFTGEPLDGAALTTLFDLTEKYSDTLRFVLPYERWRAAELVELAERLQSANAQFRAEVGEWLRANDDRAADGICLDGLGLSTAAAWLLRHIGPPTLHARRSHTLTASASALIVVTAEDDQVALLRAGEILERLLLSITTLGLQSSLMNQPVEIESLRQRVWLLAGSPHPPQAMVRIGRARPVARAMPRRRLEAVLR